MTHCFHCFGGQKGLKQVLAAFSLIEKPFYVNIGHLQVTITVE